MTITGGVRLGPYEIVAPIGAGGMGEIYRARDTRLGRDVAIKVLPGPFAADPERLRRFEQEARAVAALSHPNILALYDIGSAPMSLRGAAGPEAIPSDASGLPRPAGAGLAVTEGAGEVVHYLVTELLEGESLRERLRGSAPPVRKAVELAVQIAQGLAAAHEKGIVHRDLKPANVFVTRDGHVKILDFGIAKLVQADPGPQGTTVTPTPSTQTGALLGTAGYMAPEQVRGQAVDQRSDIFSFGCVLYEMLGGRSPFQKDTTAETMTAILHDDPPALGRIGREIPQALEGIVARCLEKRPEDRFDTAHDLALALRAATGGTEVPVPSEASARVPRIRTSWLLAAAAMGLLAVVAVLLIRVPWRGAAPEPAFDAGSVVVEPFENRTGDSSLDSVGRQIADTLTNDLLQTGELKVRAGTPVAAARGEGAADHVGPDALLRLAQTTHSALVVAGTVDLRGDQLEVQARVVEPLQATVVYTATSLRCPRADPITALEPLRQRVTGAVVWRSDSKQRKTWTGFHTPRYDALVEYRLAQASSDDSSTLSHLEKAAALDPEFYAARLARVNGLSDAGRPDDADKELAVLEANSDRMMPGERMTVGYCRAELDGRILDALAVHREMAALSGFPEDFLWVIGAEELHVNHPAEAVRDLSTWTARSGAVDHPDAYYPTFLLGAAYHVSRDYEGQLRTAREGQRRFAGKLIFYAQEASALAALGRLDEVEQTVAACEAQVVGQQGTPAAFMSAIASELRAHGHREAGLRIGERELAWWQTHPNAEGCQPCMMEALAQSERWSDAKAIADRLLAKKPEDIGLRGAVGRLAARIGDGAQAREIDSELAAIARPHLYGSHTYQRACIAALLGEKDRAVVLLRDAFAQGREFDYKVHREMDLESLRGYQPFEELMKPKG